MALLNNCILKASWAQWEKETGLWSKTKQSVKKSAKSIKWNQFLFDEVKKVAGTLQKLLTPEVKGYLDRSQLNPTFVSMSYSPRKKVKKKTNVTPLFSP